MAAAFDPSDPLNLAPEQRLHKLTNILAVGVRRVLALRAEASRPSRTP
jgi:hypothetical protein